MFLFGAALSLQPTRKERAARPGAPTQTAQTTPKLRVDSFGPVFGVFGQEIFDARLLGVPAHPPW